MLMIWKFSFPRDVLFRNCEIHNISLGMNTQFQFMLADVSSSFVRCKTIKDDYYNSVKGGKLHTGNYVIER